MYSLKLPTKPVETFPGGTSIIENGLLNLDVEDLKPGVYFLIITTATETFTSKFVIQR